ncbi:MAG: hypothetical protein RLZZ342_13 [Candidatus Parcubacteria bacterium]|jgi:D-alanine-D-alanine ligase
MVRTTVGVLRGGTSSEYEHSLKSGAALMAALPEDKYDTRDIFIDTHGMWHRRGMPADPARALAQLDVVLNVLHGGVGEDGSVQRMLERAGVPFAGSRASAAATAHNKRRARETLQAVGIQMPQAVSFSIGIDATTAEMARMVFDTFGPPYVIKPMAESGGHGIRIATTILELPDALGDMLEVFGGVIVEEFIRGRESSVEIIEGFRREDLYALPPTHIELPDTSRVFDAPARSQTRIATPGNFAHTEKEALMSVARAAHKALQLSHFSRADIMLSHHGVPYLLEVNTTPKLHEDAALPQLLDYVGSSVREFSEHLVQLAR